LRGSVFSLCASAIGSGVLSLPYVLKLCGWVIGLIYIIVGAFAACWSLYLIAEAAIRVKANNISQLARKAGGPVMEKILSVMILIYMYGSCISY